MDVMPEQPFDEIDSLRGLEALDQLAADRIRVVYNALRRDHVRCSQGDPFFEGFMHAEIVGDHGTYVLTYFIHINARGKRTAVIFGVAPRDQFLR